MVPVDDRIPAFLAGDTQAGEQLLLELLPRVRNVIRALVGRDAEVDDLAQLVMVHVISGLGGFRGDSPLVGWVDRITVRVTLSQVKRQRAQRGAESEFDEDRPSRLPKTELTGSNGERYVEKRHAVRLLDALPASQKSAVVLHHALGFTVAEVAEYERVSTETVRSRLRLALTKLRSWTSGDVNASQPGLASPTKHTSQEKEALR